MAIASFLLAILSKRGENERESGPLMSPKCLQWGLFLLLFCERFVFQHFPVPLQLSELGFDSRGRNDTNKPEEKESQRQRSSIKQVMNPYPILRVKQPIRRTFPVEMQQAVYDRERLPCALSQIENYLMAKHTDARKAEA